MTSPTPQDGEMGDLVTIAATVDGGYSGGYLNGEDEWEGCLHDPHPTRHQALACTEQRLKLEQQ